MMILGIGKKIQTEELKQKLSLADHELVLMDDTNFQLAKLNDFDVIFDLSFDERSGDLSSYAALSGKLIVVSSVKKQLANAASNCAVEIQCYLAGINALPGFINRPLAEIALFNRNTEKPLQEAMAKMNWSYKIVGDRVGMVTPRIIFMIINEACYTVQEGTASMADIDVSMKLGTNYPWGPFEWANKVGIETVYETLEAIYADTGDMRYKACPLLKTKYLKKEKF